MFFHRTELDMDSSILIGSLYYQILLYVLDGMNPRIFVPLNCVQMARHKMYMTFILRDQVVTPI